MHPRTDLAPLVFAAAAGVVGHFAIVRPFVDALGGPPRATACLAHMEVVPPAPLPMPAMVEAPEGAPFVGPFHAVGSHPDGWRAEFRGRTAIQRGAVVAVVPGARVARMPGASHAALLSARLDLATRAEDGSLTVVQRGVPVDLSRRVHEGEAVTLPGLDLALPRVGARALQGAVLVVSLGVRSPYGPAEIQVPMDPAAMEAVAVRALAREATLAPAPTRPTAAPAWSDPPRP